MILSTILCDIKERMEDSGYFSSFYEYAELVKEFRNGDSVIYPRYYIGNGSYKKIYKFENGGSGYIRKSGRVETKEDKKISTTSCEYNFLKMTHKMRLVAGVPKSRLSDNPFSDEKLVYEMIEILSEKIVNVSNIHDLTSEVTSYETNRNDVWDSEVKGIDGMINPKLSYVSVDFNLILTVKKDCLIDDCY